MDQGLIPRRYAKALFEVAKENGNPKLLYTQMQQLSAAFAAEPALAATMRNPFVSDSDKASLIMTAAQAQGDKALDNFVKLLIANGRIDLMREIAQAYQQIYRKANNIYLVEVASAAPMAPAEEDRLKALIASKLKGGTMEYSFKVDPDLIGGFVVTIDNERLDASVKNELKQLRLKLLSNI